MGFSVDHEYLPLKDGLNGRMSSLGFFSFHNS